MTIEQPVLQQISDYSPKATTKATRCETFWRFGEFLQAFRRSTTL